MLLIVDFETIFKTEILGMCSVMYIHTQLHMPIQ
jgi:hypothetical protein